MDAGDFLWRDGGPLRLANEHLASQQFSLSG